MLPNSVGMIPVKLFLATSRYVKLSRLPNSVGMEPTKLLSQSSRISIGNEGVRKNTRQNISNTHTSHMDEYINGYARSLQHNNLKISYSHKILNLLRLPKTTNSVVTLSPMILLERVNLSIGGGSTPKVK